MPGCVVFRFPLFIFCVLCAFCGEKHLCLQENLTRGLYGLCGFFRMNPYNTELNAEEPEKSYLFPFWVMQILYAIKSK